MRVTPTQIPDVLEILPDVHSDQRGNFFESYNRQDFFAAGIRDEFHQDNLSTSSQGVLRGLHYQTGEFAQGKLVSVVVGTVFDVAVDIRPDSPTYGTWVGRELSAENCLSLYIPAGFAHGFYVLSTQARFSYKISGGQYSREHATGIRFDDPKLAIAWPITPGTTPILSAQDASLPRLS